MPSPGWNLVRHRSDLKVPIRNVRSWLRVLNNSDLGEISGVRCF